MPRAQCKVIEYLYLFKTGWRSEMEDSMIVRTDLPDGNQIFGVFDGHGGIYLNLYSI
jgi:serine/threonine protein phosphatase PrpC